MGISQRSIFTNIESYRRTNRQFYINLSYNKFIFNYYLLMQMLNDYSSLLNLFTSSKSNWKDLICEVLFSFKEFVQLTLIKDVKKTDSKVSGSRRRSIINELRKLHHTFEGSLQLVGSIVVGLACGWSKYYLPSPLLFSPYKSPLLSTTRFYHRKNSTTEALANISMEL